MGGKKKNKDKAAAKPTTEAPKEEAPKTEESAVVKEEAIEKKDTVIEEKHADQPAQEPEEHFDDAPLIPEGAQ